MKVNIEPIPKMLRNNGMICKSCELWGSLCAKIMSWYVTNSCVNLWCDQILPMSTQHSLYIRSVKAFIIVVIAHLTKWSAVSSKCKPCHLVRNLIHFYIGSCCSMSSLTFDSALVCHCICHLTYRLLCCFYSTVVMSTSFLCDSAVVGLYVYYFVSFAIWSDWTCCLLQVFCQFFFSFYVSFQDSRIKNMLHRY